MTADLDAFEFSSYRGFNAQLIRWRYEALTPYLHGRSCLELGSSDGQGTEFLLARFEAVTAVDGSAAAVRGLRERLGHAAALTAVESYFEDLALDERFDTVVVAHVLEHVDDPRRVLEVAREHLADDGVLIADVPNALSIHRRLGVRLGLLDRVTDLNEADRSIGHQRVYTPEAFHAELRGAGLRVRHAGGVFLKVLSNAQVEELLDAEQQRAFLELGAELPELAAEIYAVCARAPAAD
jgi:SAM-dependent methyltransferase